MTSRKLHAEEIVPLTRTEKRYLLRVVVALLLFWIGIVWWLA
jgi:hypothetical protein